MTDLRRFNVRTIAGMLGGAGPFRPFAPGTDRKAWVAIAETVGASALEALEGRAAADRAAPIEPLPASLYLDFERTGRREPFEDALRRRRNSLYRLVLAECLTWSGVNLDAIGDLLWARLEETNWSWPAHAKGQDEPEHPTIDLAAAMTALDLAEADYLLGDRLDSRLHRRIRFEVNRRCLAPFLERHDHWWLGRLPDRQLNNWTAVCIAGVVGAACYLEEDTDRLAEIIARGLPALAEYLETFDSRGGSTEGPDYWSYGFGNYAILAQLLEARTDGGLRLLDDPFVREIAQFPLRTRVGPGLWASFSDSDEWGSLQPGLLRLLSERLELGNLEGLGVANAFEVDHFNQFIWPLRQYLWPVRGSETPHVAEGHEWFPDMAWMFARFAPKNPDALQLAVKGGHNAEMHNQNDVGSFIVALNGTSVVCDPGRGRYSKAYFGPERYDFLATSSLGHSVPVVNGQPQRPGRQYAARVLEHAAGSDADRLVLDLTGAYDASAGLNRLERTIALERRDAGVVVVSDSYAFAAGPASFESIIVTLGNVEAGADHVLLTREDAALQIDFDAGALEVECERHAGMEKQYAPVVDVTRVIFRPRQMQAEGRIALTMQPVPSRSA